MLLTAIACTQTSATGARRTPEWVYNIVQSTVTCTSRTSTHELCSSPHDELSSVVAASSIEEVDQRRADHGQDGLGEFYDECGHSDTKIVVPRGLRSFKTHTLIVQSHNHYNDGRLTCETPTRH